LTVVWNYLPTDLRQPRPRYDLLCVGWDFKPYTFASDSQTYHAAILDSG